MRNIFKEVELTMESVVKEILTTDYAQLFDNFQHSFENDFEKAAKNLKD